MLIDFHTHSTASDGALPPETLIDRALAREIDWFAITDHDTVAGYQAAAQYYRQIQGKMRLIAGVELSCRWSGGTVHIVGLGVDCETPEFSAGLAQLAKARIARGEKIAQRLAKLGFHGALEGAVAEAGESQLGRPHFAAWMIQQGHVKDFREAFDRYLGQGKVGDVKAFWPELEEVLQWLRAAGGIAVLAHPLHYRYTRAKLRRLLADFAAGGGGAIEILSGVQTSDQAEQLRRIAGEFNLLVSGGSDFHRDAPYAAQLGVELRHLGSLEGVWQHLVDPANAAE